MPDLRERWWTKDTVAIVSGSSKGIGEEIVKALTQQGVTAVLTGRDAAAAAATAERIGRELRQEVPSHQLDITSDESVTAFAQFVAASYGGVDILVNNAGLAFKGSTFGAAEARQTMETNVYGTARLTAALLPLLRSDAPSGCRVVNVCSSAGKLRIVRQDLRARFQAAASLEDVRLLVEEFVAAVADGTFAEKGWPKSMYGVSKVRRPPLPPWPSPQLPSCDDAPAPAAAAPQLAEAAYTRVLAAQLPPPAVVSAVCPGWCRTAMSSWSGPNSAAQGADTPVWLALAPAGSIPTGRFWAARREEPY